MNNHTAVLVLVFSFILTTMAFGQTDAQPSIEAPWRLVFFPVGDESGTESIHNLDVEGYVPVGIEYTLGESLAVLLVNDESVALGRWAITRYTDWNQLEDDITATIRDGFVPMDISRYGDALAVLWLETDLPLEGWRISASENSQTERSRTLRSFETSGFTLHGVSVNQDLVWYLFLRLGETARATQLLTYPMESAAIQNGLITAADQGWRPTGIATTDSLLYVSYVK
ncbi:MAG: hypothetical protein KOO61_03135 [Spirochaetales bacterium]|nr:hypothetical protein [Spirochaetales bacterium]